MGRACSTNGGEDECLSDTGGTARRKETTKKTRCRWVHKNKIDLRGIGWGGMNCIDLAQERDQWRVLVTTVMNLRVP
jgi:hypothetical protein